MRLHDGVPIWDVDIICYGPVAIQDEININARKELQSGEPFYSDIKISPRINGFSATVSAFAPEPKLAEKAALFFFGRMIDALTLKIDMPMQLDILENVIRQKNREKIRLRIDRTDLVEAFNEARLLSLTETTFLRALGWYRKGKNTSDPFDKFLAYWNSIETVASKYNPNKLDCKKKGSKCHIWECFKTIWGKDCTDWEIIPGRKSWIDDCYAYRNDIAHGIIPVEMEFIEKIVLELDIFERVAYKFLIDWRRQLRPDITENVRGRLA
jgi:hypothetical protein